jgi:hypothetical protein
VVGEQNPGKSRVEVEHACRELVGLL